MVVMVVVSKEKPPAPRISRQQIVREQENLLLWQSRRMPGWRGTWRHLPVADLGALCLLARK